MDMVTLPKFAIKNYDFWVVQKKKNLRCKELIEYCSSNPYDEVCDALILDLIKQALDENFLCQLVNSTSSQEVCNIRI